MPKRKGKKGPAYTSNLPSIDESPKIVCRLCETKEGPFLDIFNGEKNAGKNIQIMPFKVSESDELPHQICFRCSAKVEEFNEFLQKCLKTQENIHKAAGKTFSPTWKTHKSLWEGKLNQLNLNNHDICQTAIKKVVGSCENTLENDIKLLNSKAAAKISQVIDDLKKKGLEIKKVVPTTSSKDLTVNEPKAGSSKHDEMCNTSKGSGSSPLDDENRIHTVKDTFVTPEPPNQLENKKEAKSFNIMGHVSKIKVNGVGVLFQCNLCNRNFLKKEVVEVHRCVKNVAAKESVTKSVASPTPKISTVKYINTKKVDLNKPQMENKTVPVEVATDEIKKDAPGPKLKPRIGPASKTKQQQQLVNIPPTLTSANYSSLVPNVNTSNKSASGSIPVAKSQPEQKQYQEIIKEVNKVFKTEPKRRKVLRSDHGSSNQPATLQKPNSNETVNIESRPYGSSNQPATLQKPNSNETVNIDSRPYPVGLFRTLKPNPSKGETSAAVIPFTTTELKRQSYTVVPTGNPSKILISVKPQPDIEDVRKKTSSNKKKSDSKSGKPNKKKTVSLEDASHPKDSNSLFNFINVDLLSQPSYVLPTDNTIIPETQIPTSSKHKIQTENKSEQYTCNMCNAKFTREQKLLAHINSHYNKMDEEDQARGKSKRPKKALRA